MPRYPIDRATNFIVEDESWTVVEYDHTSVPGVIYLSLTEGKINLEYDNLEEPYADEDKLAVYKFAVPEEPQIFTIDKDHPIQPTFTLMKNGFICNEEVEWLSKDHSIVDKNLCAIKEGVVTLIGRLKQYPQIEQEIEVEVSNIQEILYYIEGNDKLRLDRKNTFTLIGTNGEEPSGVVFSLDNTIYAKILPNDTGKTNSCIVKANDENKLGEVVLRAQYAGKEYTKTITIIPLW